LPGSIVDVKYYQRSTKAIPASFKKVAKIKPTICFVCVHEFKYKENKTATKYNYDVFVGPTQYPSTRKRILYSSRFCMASSK
jgi:hypothetical protein